MEYTALYEFCRVFIWVLVFVARFSVEKMVDTANEVKRFLLILFNMGLYTAFVGMFIYLTYEGALHNSTIGMEEFYQEILVGILGINFAAIIVAIFYYFMRKKRKISDMDKMKLKDL